MAFMVYAFSVFLWLFTLGLQYAFKQERQYPECVPWFMDRYANPPSSIVAVVGSAITIVLFKLLFSKKITVAAFNGQPRMEVCSSMAEVVITFKDIEERNEFLDQVHYDSRNAGILIPLSMDRKVVEERVSVFTLDCVNTILWWVVIVFMLVIYPLTTWWFYLCTLPQVAIGIALAVIPTTLFMITLRTCLVDINLDRFDRHMYAKL